MQIEEHEITREIMSHDVYVVIDEPQNGVGDIFLEYYTSRDEAIDAAEAQWQNLTDNERRRRRVSASLIADDHTLEWSDEGGLENWGNSDPVWDSDYAAAWEHITSEPDVTRPPVVWVDPYGYGEVSRRAAQILIGKLNDLGIETSQDGSRDDLDDEFFCRLEAEACEEADEDE